VVGNVGRWRSGQAGCSEATRRPLASPISSDPLPLHQVPFDSPVPFGTLAITQLPSVSFGFLRCPSMSFDVLRCPSVSLDLLPSRSILVHLSRCHSQRGEASFGLIECRARSGESPQILEICGMVENGRNETAGSAGDLRNPGNAGTSGNPRQPGDSGNSGEAWGGLAGVAHRERACVRAGRRAVGSADRQVGRSGDRRIDGSTNLRVVGDGSGIAGRGVVRG
jgi:hypothetical protein